MPQLIAFLTDYGTRDGFAAVCHGVITQAAPGVQMLDVSHDVPPQDVRHGAAVLARVARYLPPAIFLAVVDPGVGTSRRGVALAAGRSMLVGPDNGLLLPAAEVLGGITEARVLSNMALWLPDVDQTFHGRDIFAPVAAHLAHGGAMSEVGELLKPADLTHLPEPRREVADGRLTCEVTYVDRFANVQLAGGPEDLELLREWAVRGPEEPQGHIDIEAGDRRDRAAVGTTFGDVATGELLAYCDSDGRLALAVNNGEAAARLGVRTGDVVHLRRPTAPA
ncbi:SAM hydrolase/SAM-dependent halogenase family protein [Actinopolymorpha alba]|uniref:SAM hydrolase/SAM-dependent halogenase family protein n=1 Tax=Actinopolymorpha alba TaxID=533267 RepID=UPI000375BDCB|nr:SAM-dependent chlorinase/fluorinase [Actinopolymorpha alba]